MQVLPIWQNLEIRTKCKSVGVELAPKSPERDDNAQEAECVEKMKKERDELKADQSDAPQVCKNAIYVLWFCFYGLCSYVFMVLF